MTERDRFRYRRRTRSPMAARRPSRAAAAIGATPKDRYESVAGSGNVAWQSGKQICRAELSAFRLDLDGVGPVPPLARRASQPVVTGRSSPAMAVRSRRIC